MNWTATAPSDTSQRWTIEIGQPRTADELPAAVAEAMSMVEAHESFANCAVNLWLPNVDEHENEPLLEAGFRAYRDLWQLRVDLPVSSTTLATVAYSDDDAAAFLSVNNRAFSWHPEQGGMTLADLAERQKEPWYRVDDFRMHHIEGRLAGFNWLKVHRPEEGSDFDPPMGEIYVIAVDPDFHGRGLGTDLALAGLNHLADQGLTRAMLYVESDNDAANRVYERIGFVRAQTNRAFTNAPTDDAPAADVAGS